MPNPFQEDEWDDVSVSQLVEQVRGGCEKSQEQLFGQLHRYLAFIANENLEEGLRAKVGASDIVQQSFVKAIEGFHQFRGNTSAEFRGWLKQIAVNELRQVRRGFHTDKRQISREQRIDQESRTSRPQKQLVDSLFTPGAKAMAHEEADALKTALERLPEMYRQVIRLRNWEGLQFSEISDRLGITTSNAAKLWYRGLIRLQEEFESQGQ